MKKRLLFFLLLIFGILNLYTQPSSPILVEPPKEASVVSLTPTLTWNAVAGADCYFIYITTDTTGAKISEVCMTSTNSYVVPANQLQPDQVYYWTVEAHDASGWSAPAFFYSFKTQSTTAAGSINNLISQVNSLSASGRLNATQADILNIYLAQAKLQLELNNTFTAIVHMYIFKLRTYILRFSDMLSASDQISLNYSADGVIDLIQDLSPLSQPKELKPVKEFALYQNYPNPFNPSTTIEYSIPGNSMVSLKVYDLLGKEVTTLVNKYQQGGRYIVTWNASNLSSGVYIYKLSAGNYTETKKMILNK